MNKYLERHLLKYPHMQIEDKIKLIMQAHLGPGHLVNDYQMVLNRLHTELNELSNQTVEMVEEIGDNYVRIYLEPYYKKHQSFDDLIKIFVLSSKEEKDYEGFFKELNNLRENLNKEEQRYLDEYIDSKDYLISHSKTYKEMYHPHYLVVHKKYL